MVQQLLWLEIVAKGAIGLLLLATPGTFARLAGLGRPEDPLWPRLCGALLAGLALASLVESRLLPGKGLGLAGSAAINLALAVVIGALLILGRGGPIKRGRVLLGLVATGLGLLGLVEIVAAG